MPAHVEADDHQQAQLHDFAGLHGQAADVEPVLGTVGFLADDKGQCQHGQRYGNHQQHGNVPVADDPHQIDAHHHGAQSHTVVHGLLISVVGIGGIEHQHAKRTKKICQGKQQLIRWKQAAQKVCAHGNHGRYAKGKGKGLPGKVLQPQQDKSTEEEEHDHLRQPLPWVTMKRDTVTHADPSF